MLTNRSLRRAAAVAVALLALAACGDDDATDTDVENQEEVDSGGSATTEVAPGGGVGTTGGNTDQGNVEPDSPDDTTQDTAHGMG